MSDLDALIDLVVSDAELATGRPLEWMLAQGAHAPRPVQGKPAPAPSPRWTPEEDQFLKDNLGYMSLEAIAEQLGRSVLAVKVHFTRKGYTPARNTPGYLSGNEIANILGVDSHCPPCWIDLGILKGEHFPYPGRVCRRVRVIDFKMWIIRPTSWVHFRVEAIGNPSLRRLVQLAQSRWGDEWWTTRQAADYLLCTPNSIHDQIQRGRLYGYHALGLDRRREQTWAYWFVRKSDVERLHLPTYADSKLKFTPAADAFMLKARLEWGLTPAVIARMMKRPMKSIDYRIRYLCKKNGIEKISLIGKSPRKEMECICMRCQQPYMTKSYRVGYCPECRIPARRERELERYHQDHPGSQYRIIHEGGK